MKATPVDTTIVKIARHFHLVFSGLQQTQSLFIHIGHDIWDQSEAAGVSDDWCWDGVNVTVSPLGAAPSLERWFTASVFSTYDCSVLVTWWTTFVQCFWTKKRKKCIWYYYTWYVCVAWSICTWFQKRALLVVGSKLETISMVKVPGCRVKAYYRVLHA